MSSPASNATDTSEQGVIDLEGECVNGKWDTNNYNSKKIDKLIGEMIALHNLPFNFVNGNGFSRLINELAPNYNLRNNFFPNFVCKELYQKVSEKINELLKNFDYMSFTSGIWSDPNSNDTFLTLTCYGIAENFDRSAILLKCEILDDHDNSDIIDEKFDMVLSEWNIKKEKVHCLTHDKCSKMKRAMPLANFPETDCTVHKIQQAIRNCLHSQQNIQVVKKKCKKITAHFKHSSTALKELQKIQDRMNQSHFKVLEECVKPWNKTYYMFTELLWIKDALNFYTNANDIDPILPEDWQTIECCINLLKPFESAISELSKSEALISSVIPIIQLLRKKLNDFLTNSHKFDPILLAVTTLKTELSAMFSTLFEENNIYVIATYLDPRYKNKLFTPVTEEKIKIDILKMIYDDDVLEFFNFQGTKRMRIGDTSENDINSARDGMDKVMRVSFLNELDRMLKTSVDESQNTWEKNKITALLKKELLAYHKNETFHVYFNPLKWWHEYRKEFKLLSKLARRFLSPPPASITKEELFRSTDIIYKPIRNDEPEKAAIILFIKYNIQSFNFFY